MHLWLYVYQITCQTLISFYWKRVYVCVCVGGVIMFYDETKRLEHHDALENSFNVDKGKVDILF